MSRRSATISRSRRPDSHSDDELIRYFRDGSEEAFGILHDRYWDAILRYVRRTLPGAVGEDAEDVTQDAFLRAYRALRADEREIRFRPWLYRIAHNHCLDQRRRRVHGLLELHDDVAGASDPAADAEAREQLFLVVGDIRCLPRTQRAAVVLRELGGLPYEAIAAELCVTVPAVKSLLARARRYLRGASEGRATPCVQVRAEMRNRLQHGPLTSERARHHLRACRACADYQSGLL
jgi:RNA polymerase sigma factor (sigma-70 family)